jgi:uncharacterized protein YjbJ (UPF0337 family)
MGERMDEIKGRVKEAAGKLTDDDQLERSGTADRMGAKVKGAVEAGKDKVEEWVDESKKKMRKD